MYRREGELSFHKPIGRPVKSESEKRELERLRMDAKHALLKKFHTELRKVQLGQRNIGRSTTTWDNAPMENFFGHLKEEYLRQFKQTTFKDTEQLIDEYIYFYNYERTQLKTRQTPFETRCLSS